MLLAAPPPLAAHADPIHEAAATGDLVELGRLLAQDPSGLERPDKDGKTPLRRALEGKRPEVVSLLIAKGASPLAADVAGVTPLLYAVAELASSPSEDNPAVTALCAALPSITLRLANAPLRDAWAQIFAQVHLKATVAADAFAAPATLTLDTAFDAALRALVRLTRRISGQTPVITVSAGAVQVGISGAPIAPPLEDETWPVFTHDPRFKFSKTISRPVLENYLRRAVEHQGLLASSPEETAPYFDDDLRMLTAIGVKFVSSCAYAWVPPDNDDQHFRVATEHAQRLHRADPEMILQAAVFESAYRKVENIPIPEWVFREFGLPVETRNFRYEAMLYDNGKFRDHWMHDASVPDMAKRETRFWFYYRARRYIDAGCEAIHFGQVHLMDQSDPGHAHWRDVLARIRRYANRSARRGIVLCDANTHGVAERSVLLFDFHTWPLRPAEAPTAANPQGCVMRAQYSDSIILHSMGGITPSGWSCDSLPYLVGFDSCGINKPGQGGLGAPWVWGYDEICWFAHQSESERNRFLGYARDWLRQTDQAGFFQPSTRRGLAASADGVGTYQANRKSDACPIGFNQEETIRAIFAA